MNERRPFLFLAPEDAPPIARWLAPGANGGIA
jgi:hypothetical protein